MIKAVVFDLDDTLFPEYDFVLSGFAAVNDWIERHYYIKGFFEIARQLFETGLRGKIFDNTLERLGVRPNAYFIQALLSVYRQHIPIISLYEDAQWAIDYLKSNKLLGIITDGYLQTQQNKIAALGLARSVNAIVYSDMYGRGNWKPSSVPYLKIVELLGCQGPECMYIGDNPSKDFITAKLLGWQTVHVCRLGGEYSAMYVEKMYEADYKLASLYELKNLMKA